MVQHLVADDGVDDDSADQLSLGLSERQGHQVTQNNCAQSWADLRQHECTVYRAECVVGKQGKYGQLTHVVKLLDRDEHEHQQVEEPRKKNLD